MKFLSVGGSSAGGSARTVAASSNPVVPIEIPGSLARIPTPDSSAGMSSVAVDWATVATTAKQKQQEQQLPSVALRIQQQFRGPIRLEMLIDRSLSKPRGCQAADCSRSIRRLAMKFYRSLSLSRGPAG